MPEKQAQPNQSAQKLLRIIEIMAAGGRMRLLDIATAAELPASTALRLVHTLCEEGYAMQDPETLRYALSMKLAKIGGQISAGMDLVGVAHPQLLALSRSCGESCSIAVEEGGEVVYIDVVDGPDGLLKITQRIGKRAPMHCTGIGKLLLSNDSSAQFNSRLKGRRLQGFTPHTITDSAALRAELRIATEKGYAMDDEECELGARCIAAPIRDHTGRVIAGISITGPVHRMTPEYIRSTLPLLTGTAEKITKLLGG